MLDHNHFSAGIWRRSLRSVPTLCVITLFLLSVSPVFANDLLDMDFEDLLNIQVSSASKTPTSLMKTAAAVAVISREDIHRSGASNIPEVLRMVSGVQVAQLDANRWAVTIRGFNGQTANKLLVMIDGRSIYTPTFSGTYWDTLDVSLEEIERIEVVRGPGAALWGANAVNGVINIITSTTLENSTDQITGWVGLKKHSGISVLKTIKPNEANALRLSLRGLERDQGSLQGEGNGDDTTQGRIGLRWDNHGSNYALHTTASYYQGRESTTYNSIEPTAPYICPLIDDADLSGGHIQSRYSYYFRPTSTLDIQLYYDYSSRHEWLYDQRLQQYDLDIQHTSQPLAAHRLTWGGGIDISRDYYHSRRGQINITPEHSHAHLFSFFAQDDYSILSNLTVTLGTKCEHNEVTGWEWQPNLRLLWQATPRLSLWGAVSRAVRTPSHVEENGSLILSIEPPSALTPMPWPTMVTLQGDHDIDSEDLIAWELGTRFAINNSASCDIAMFIHDYDNLQGGHQQATSATNIDGQPVYVVNYGADNNFAGYSYGAEVAANWQVVPTWSLLLAYSFLDMNLDQGNAQEITVPERYTQHHLSLQSRLNINRNWQTDCWLTYNDGIKSQDISPRWEMQLRIGWQPQPEWELELIGHNLLHDDSKEIYSELSSMQSSRSERGVLLRLTYKY
ncbi:MAG: TonB-dependent receptor [Desulfuromonas sp.]|nr:TonB-dependent receptor [Desulfuromonas sp.]